mmetsp:Transcript_7834/g.12131  ORF Transcript_7834/g.12131 Transcript_7834/m.12131 type:complete len:441 (+) Transcript_7834:63-1385(+)|eukprot:CAMPEP_0202704206 /NCGR_PEP_ID=MMETSP1385-20130828/16925_1 /ASSEMBLY_ACC=CAM_ASM_000861 /TAXON_ID=933848 /ORGANISM="Elphidium margaritaceum" /LENGTH=440 /DNA_ID=CAMNT_0049362179 /DNA_START=57 /DNA_END=1379 /DNA_ORIENTATION=-
MGNESSKDPKHGNNADVDNTEDISYLTNTPPMPKILSRSKRSPSYREPSKSKSNGSTHMSTLQTATTLHSSHFNLPRSTIPTISPNTEPHSSLLPALPRQSQSLPTIPRKASQSAPTLHRRNSSVLGVHNGITDKYISSRICKIAGKFWKDNVETLAMEDQLEVGCSIFFGMLSTNDSMKKVMKANLNERNKKIEQTSLRYLDMLGWLIRYLCTDNIDLYQLLTNLGVYHQKMGIKIEHFEPMLNATQETFSYYFEQKYTLEVKYALDEIFALAAQMMTGQELKCSHFLSAVNNQFKCDEIPFLKNLDACLKSKIGIEYLYRFLSQTWCDEIVVFHRNWVRFQAQPSAKEKFMIARQIIKSSIDNKATFTLNLSYIVRITTMENMKVLEQQFIAKQELQSAEIARLFDPVVREVKTLIAENHWNKFVASIRRLQHKSFDV